MKFSMTRQEKGDCLIEVTALAGLAMYFFEVFLSCLKIQKDFLHLLNDFLKSLENKLQVNGSIMKYPIFLYWELAVY